MKFTTIAIIKADQATLDRIRIKLSEKSKAYLSELIIKSASLLPDVDVSSKIAVTKALSKLIGSTTFYDDKGFYVFDTVFKVALIDQCKNKLDKPFKKFDFFDSYDVFDVQMTDNLLTLVDGYDRFPDCIITSELELIKSPLAFMSTNEDSANYKELVDWKAKFKNILKEYSNNSFSLILDCHL